MHTGAGKVAIKTIYWNNGNPSLVCADKPHYGTSLYREDIWHLNVVRAPPTDPSSSEEITGRWLLYLEYEELTELWHFLKEIMESGYRNFGIRKMVCKPKVVHSSSTERPLFHVYTNSKASKAVGKRLIELLERDIYCEHKPPNSDVRPILETLYWNDGEPDYERMRHKSITKNWRTGE